MAFKAAESPKIPSLACIGYVDAISDPKETESGNYVNARVKLKGNSGTSRDIETNFLFRPEWFTPGFDPETIKNYAFDDVTEEEADRIKNGYTLNYRRIFGTSSQPGMLAVLCKTDENYEALAAKFEAAYKGATFTSGEVIDIVREFVLDVLADVGYVLKQQKEKTDLVDETGKPVYNLRDGYEVDSFFVPDEKGIKRQTNRAKKSAEAAAKAKGRPDFLVAFEVQ